ncbi:MAG: hypothetical protein EHM74_03670 [Hyphomicrobiales bacterium]|nr:MAG: hypothetical protein EHM74_03670 [Hyphomicrobiales bacterium]
MLPALADLAVADLAADFAGGFFFCAAGFAAFFAAGFFAAGFFAAFLAVLAISQTPSEPCKKQFRVRIIAEFSGKRKLKLKLCPA